MSPALGVGDSAVQSRQDFVHLLVLLGADDDPSDARCVPLHL
jgi:hypothetical protein